MADQEQVRLNLGGMHADGAAQLAPEGTTRLMQNMVARPGPVWEKRAPVSLGRNVSTDQVTGFANWLDASNRIYRTIAVHHNALSSPATSDYSVSASDGGFTLSGGSGTLSGAGAVTGFTNFAGKCYICTASNSAPTSIASYNGTTLLATAIESGQLTARCIVSYINRAFIGFAYATFTNGLGTSFAYDPTVWTPASATAELITNGDSITGRVTPTATSGAQIYKRDHQTIVAGTTATNVSFSWGVRGVSPDYAMPMTLEAYYSQAWAAATAYVVGAIRVPTTATGNGFRYRVTEISGGGLSHAATEPTWPTTAGTEVVDNEVTWICDGPDAVASTKATIPSATESLKPTPLAVVGSIPPNPASTKIGLRLKFGTTGTSTYTRAPVDVSFRDGLADGTAGKANFGAQFVPSKFVFPFFNAEDTDTVTLLLDADLYWSDPFEPDSIGSSYFYRLHESPGPVTAMCVTGRRLVVFKQYGIWIFQPTEDPDNPILLERYIANYGCKGPLAAKVFAGKIYFIGNPDELYEFEVGGDPVPVCSDEMRTRLFASSDTFTDAAVNSWCLTADETNRDLYVTTRASETGVLDLDGRGWSTFVYNSGAMFQQLWNPSNGAVYFADAIPDAAGALEALYLSGDATSAQDHSSVAVSAYVEFRHLDAIRPGRLLKLDDVQILNHTTGAQTDQTAKVEISLDGGATWSKSATYTVPTATSATLAIPFEIRGLRQQSHTMAVRLYHSGKGGGEMFRLSDAHAVIQDLGPAKYQVASAAISTVSL